MDSRYEPAISRHIMTGNISKIRRIGGRLLKAKSGSFGAHSNRIFGFAEIGYTLR